MLWLLIVDLKLSLMLEFLYQYFRLKLLLFHYYRQTRENVIYTSRS